MTSLARLAPAVASYANRMSAALGSDHHVASPLGAWLVLALAARAARGDERGALAAVLGMEVDDAATAAGDLLAEPHPALAAAAAMIEHCPGVLREAVLRFGHPYAVLAVCRGGRWDGLPVFSAWVTSPSPAG